MYDVILLDLDNTILDFDAAEKSSFIKIIEESSLEYKDELLINYKKINTTLWNKLEQGEISKKMVLNTRFTEFFKLYGIDVDGALLEEKYRFYLDESSLLIKNAKDTLIKLKKMGRKIYSASNGVYTTQIKRLKNSGIIDYFDDHFISDLISYEKPSPLFFDFCIKSIGSIEKSSILMVGDNPSSDIIGARNFGIDSCLYQHIPHITSEYATYTISDISELLIII